MGELEGGEVREYIKEEVADWEETEKIRARFKALSGQRGDWECQLFFWRDLILKICRRFNIMFVSHSVVKLEWFNLNGLTPLCLDHVLLHMYRSGHLLLLSDLHDPKSGRLSHLFRKFMSRFWSSSDTPFSSSSSSHILNHPLILLSSLQNKCTQLVELLSQTHWTSSCIITMSNFQSFFQDHRESYAVLSYLSTHAMAKYISITNNNNQLFEGVKLSLSSAPVSIIPNVDHDMLLLISTAEHLQQQLLVIDNQYQRSRQLAVASLRSGDKNVALRNARHLKLASETKAKLLSYLNRVEGVLHVISDAKSTKMVSEAVQVGAQAINDHQIEVEEVQSCLRKLDELMTSQAKVNEALESYIGDDVDVEGELHELELQIRGETSTAKENAEQVQAFTNSLATAMADLKLSTPKSSASWIESELPS